MGKTKFAIENATRCRIVLADQTYDCFFLVIVESISWDLMLISPLQGMRSVI